ncbi:unnamed protein product [Cylindrotheca closterium]|uniref:Uncharacterized protein n=1 Tax=Cylindrotheca closterium TaxID=2856 RepID=A0AAD2JHM2_9STRA|nr:unnamed protein product [Cylindrotheca closterium]
MSEALSFVYHDEPPDEVEKKTIRHVAIYKSVETIGPNSFQFCERLMEVVFPKNGLESICTSAFEKCPALESVSLPCTVTHIGKYAFRQCLALSKVKLPQQDESITSTTLDIDTKAFEGCRSLCAVSFPESTGTVGYQAFANCTSLLAVEIPSTTKHHENKNTRIQFLRNVFQGCHQLVNVSIPMQMPLGTEKCFVMCSSLQKMCYPSCDFPEALIDRYYKLPLHNMCYHAAASTTKLQEFEAFVDGYDADKYNAVDRWGMTAYHILATSPNLQNDTTVEFFLQTLMDRYPLNVILQKDRNDKTMLDYLLLYKSAKSIPVFQMVVRRLLKIGMGDWGRLDWRNDISSLVESYGRNEVLAVEHRLHANATTTAEESDLSSASSTMDWDEMLQQRRASFDEMKRRLAIFGRKEVTSLMELSLWKMKIKSSEMMSRVDCRWSCGSDFVIAQVLGYLWHLRDDDDGGDDNSTESRPALEDGLLYLNL